jgi:hypothetical protein
LKDCTTNHFGPGIVKNTGKKTSEIMEIGVDKPLYDYVKIIFDALVTQNGNANSPNKKHLWIKKATGLGNSQFMLRFMTWQIYNYIYMYIIYCHNYDNR